MISSASRSAPGSPVGHAEDVVRARGAAPANSELEAPLAEVVDGGDLLRDAQRVVEREHLHGRPRWSCRVRAAMNEGQHQRRRLHAIAPVEVDLAEPHAVQAPGFGRVRQRQRLAVRRRLRDAAPPLLEKDAEVHGPGALSAAREVEGLGEAAIGLERVPVLFVAGRVLGAGEEEPITAGGLRVQSNPRAGRAPAPWLCGSLPSLHAAVASVWTNGARSNPAVRYAAVRPTASSARSARSISLELRQELARRQRRRPRRRGRSPACHCPACRPDGETFVVDERGRDEEQLFSRCG